MEWIHLSTFVFNVSLAFVFAMKVYSTDLKSTSHRIVFLIFAATVSVLAGVELDSYIRGFIS